MDDIFRRRMGKRLERGVSCLAKSGKTFTGKDDLGVDSDTADLGLLFVYSFKVVIVAASSSFPSTTLNE